MHIFFSLTSVLPSIFFILPYKGYVMALHLLSNIPLKIHNLFWYHNDFFFVMFFHVVRSEKNQNICCSLILFIFPAKEVKKAPMFLEKLQNCGVPEGYPVRLECRVVGMPPPIFYWKKDNETIPTNRERMRYCTIIPMLEVSCGRTNCFHENLGHKYRWCSS